MYTDCRLISGAYIMQTHLQCTHHASSRFSCDAHAMRTHLQCQVMQIHLQCTQHAYLFAAHIINQSHLLDIYYCADSIATRTYYADSFAPCIFLYRFTRIMCTLCVHILQTQLQGAHENSLDAYILCTSFAKHTSWLPCSVHIMQIHLQRTHIMQTHLHLAHI